MRQGLYILLVCYVPICKVSDLHQKLTIFRVMCEKRLLYFAKIHKLVFEIIWHIKIVDTHRQTDATKYIINRRSTTDS